jgi:hypothetical protein
MPLADRHARKAPLYRKVNTRARFHRHRTGPDYRHQRKSKREKIAAEAEVKRGTMKQGVKRGLDYTPLFRFLLKNVGKDWAPVYQEAQSRLDKEDAIFWMVARREKDRQPYFVSGEASYFSGLYVADDGKLAVVDPNLKNEGLHPWCDCCTHTFNGKPFVNKTAKRG